MVILYGSQQRERAEADYGGSGNNGCLTHYSETGKSQCVTLCGILVFDGPLCYLISKVSLCVKVLLPLQHSGSQSE